MMPDDAINQIGKFMDSVNKATRGIALIQVGMAAQLEALTLPYKRIQAVVDSFAISTKILTEALRNIDTHGFEEFYKEFGWIEALPIPYAMELKDKLREGGKEAVWNEFVNDFKSNEVVNEILEQIDRNTLISQRKHILSVAIIHHKNGDYISSIPLLLSQIEGILWDYGVAKKKIKDEFNSKILIDASGMEIIESKTAPPKQANLQLLLTLIFDGESKFKEHLRDNVYTPNFRNPILHGREINYADEQRSVWLLLLLFTLTDKTQRSS